MLSAIKKQLATLLLAVGLTITPHLYSYLGETYAWWAYDSVRNFSIAKLIGIPSEATVRVHRQDVYMLSFACLGTMAMIFGLHVLVQPTPPVPIPSSPILPTPATASAAVTPVATAPAPIATDGKGVVVQSQREDAESKKPAVPKGKGWTSFLKRLHGSFLQSLGRSSTRNGVMLMTAGIATVLLSGKLAAIFDVVINGRPLEKPAGDASSAKS